MASAYKGPWSQITTFEQLLIWQDHHQHELIDGIPQPWPDWDSEPHNMVVEAVASQLQLASTRTGWQVIPNGTAVHLGGTEISDELISTVLRPDIALTCKPNRLDVLGFRGAPEWVAEVVSPASAVLDHIVKRQIYERSGVQEYWLIQPGERMLTIYRQDRHGRYEKPELYELRGETEIGVFPGIYVNWEPIVTYLFGDDG